MGQDTNRTLKCALYYASRGWPVLPLHSIVDSRCSCGSDECSSPAKHPEAKLALHGLKDATTDEKIIRSWFDTDIPLNIGICTGPGSGLVVLDVDIEKGGHTSLSELESKHGQIDTLEALTGGGGRHLYFRYPMGAQVANSVEKLGPGLDVRAAGGYVVACPSLHISGNDYSWKMDPRVKEPIPCPDWLIETHEQAPRKDLKERSIQMGEAIPQGRRNDTLTSMAGTMRRKGFSPEAIYQALNEENQNRCNPPLPDTEVRRIAESVGRYEPDGSAVIVRRHGGQDQIERRIGNLGLTLLFSPKKDSTCDAKGALVINRNNDILMMDTLDLSKEKNRQQVVKKLTDESRELDTANNRELLEKSLLEIAAETIEQRRQSAANDDHEGEIEPLAKSKVALAEVDPQLVELAQRLLCSPDLLEKTTDHVHILGVAGENDLIIAVYLIGTSRLLRKPLAGLVMGPSSVGKSYVINMTSKLFPDEAVLRAHQISPKALQYLPPGSLIHRFVVAGERSRSRDDAAAEATRALREMISDGRLSALVSASRKSGPYQTIHIEQEGPIAYIESTTLGVQEIFNEDRTRFILLCCDEGMGQSRAVIDTISQLVSSPQNPDTPDSIIALHQTAQRLLEPLDVVVPFAPALQDCLPAEHIEVRRTFGHLVALVQAVALLHQFQRQRNEQGQIIATPIDYELVRKYLVQPLATSLGCVLTPGAQTLLDVVKSMGEFTASDVEPKVPYSIGTVRSRLKELIAAGRIRQTEDAKGRSGAKYRAIEDAAPLHGLALPKLKSEDRVFFVANVTEHAVDNV